MDSGGGGACVRVCVCGGEVRWGGVRWGGVAWEWGVQGLQPCHRCWGWGFAGLLPGAWGMQQLLHYLRSQTSQNLHHRL